MSGPESLSVAAPGCLPQALPSREEHLVEHRSRQAAGERVLLTRVIRADQPSPALERDLDPVSEGCPVARPISGDPELAEQVVPSESPEGHEHPNPRHRPHFLRQKRNAPVSLLRERSVPRRGAAHDGRHPSVEELQAVVAGHRSSLVGETRPVQRTVQPVARTIPGEHPARAVRSVRRRREAHDQEAGVRIPEPRYGPAPIALVPKAPDLRPRDLFAVRDQAPTEATGLHSAVEGCQPLPASLHAARPTASVGNRRREPATGRARTRRRSPSWVLPLPAGVSRSALRDRCVARPAPG